MQRVESSRPAGSGSESTRRELADFIVQDHATKQMLRAKSRLAAKRFRLRAGAGFMDRAPAGHKGLAPKSKADRGGGCKGGHLLA